MAVYTPRDSLSNCTCRPARVFITRNHRHRSQPREPVQGSLTFKESTPADQQWEVFSLQAKADLPRRRDQRQKYPHRSRQGAAIRNLNPPSNEPARAEKEPAVEMGTGPKACFRPPLEPIGRRSRVGTSLCHQLWTRRGTDWEIDDPERVIAT